MSAAQLGIWLGQQQASEPGLYQVASLYVCAQLLDQPLLEQAIAQCCGESSALRLRFGESGLPQVEILEHPPEAVLQVERHRLVVNATAASDEQQLMHYAEQEVRQPLAIETGVGLRHIVIDSSDGASSTLLIIAHHITFDGYALSLYASRLFAVYEALLCGTPICGPQLNDWQPVLEEESNYANSPRPAAALQFYRKHLAHHPTSHLRTQATTPLRQQRRLPPEYWQRISLAAKSAQLAPSELIIALGAVEMARLHQQQVFSVGIPLMQRLGSKAARTPCMHMNIAPLPIDLRQVSNVYELAHACGAFMRKARPHYGLRYETLSAHVTRGRSPFLGVINLMPYVPPLRLAQEKVRVIAVAAGPCLDLSLAISPTAEALACSLEVHPSLFSAEQQNELLDRFAEQLKNPQPRAPVCLPASAAPVHSVVEGPPPPTPLWPLRKLAEAFLPTSSFARDPAVANLVDDQPTSRVESQLDYLQLAHATAACARELQQLGVNPGDLVAISASRAPSTIVALLGILACDAAYVFVDPSYPLARRSALLRAAPLRIYLVEGETSVGAPSSLQQLPIGPRALERWLHAEAPHRLQLEKWRRGPCERELAAYVMYTSGSTGQPKGVAIGQNSLARFLAAAAARYGLAAHDSVLQFAPFGFDASVEEIFVSLSVGARLVLRNDTILESCADFVNGCAELSVLDLPTAYFHELARGLKSTGLRLPENVRLVIVGGEALDAHSAAQFCAHHPQLTLLNTYGPTEATVVATAHALRGTEVSAEEPPALGKPLPGVRALLVDSASGLLTCAREGELALQGTLALGYLSHSESEHTPPPVPSTSAALGSDLAFNAELTDARFVHFPGEGRAYLTGDRVRLDETGCLHYLGRVDDEVKISGVRIQPAEVEQLLRTVSGVEQAFVLSIEEGAQRQLGAVLRVSATALEDAATTVELCRAVVRDRLPAAFVPSRFQLLEELPLSVHGKLDRRALRGLFSDSPESAMAIPLALQQTEFARALCTSWQQVLGAPPRGCEDDFFESGGTSLHVIQLVQRMLERGFPVSARQVFQGRTAIAIAQSADHKGNAGHQESSFVPRKYDWDFASYCKPSPAALLRPRILLTGATGYVGRELLLALLRSSDAELVCLVRAPNLELARERIRQVCPTSASQRVHVLLDTQTDATFEQAPQWMRALDSEPACTAIYHCAAAVSLTRSYDSLYASNVALTGQLLQRALRWGSSFHFVSTIATVPPEDGQERLSRSTTHLLDGYQRSKWHAEQLVEQASSQGLPAQIFRLGRVVGRRDCVQVNPQDLVWRILRAALHVQAWPDLQVSEPWSPVDETAQLIVRLSQARAGSESANCRLTTSSTADHAEVYHLIQWGLVALPDIQRSLFALGMDLPTQSLAQWLSTVAERGDDEDRATISFFEQAPPPARERAELIGRRASEVLETIPTAFTPQCVEHYVRHALKHFS